MNDSPIPRNRGSKLGRYVIGCLLIFVIGIPALIIGDFLLWPGPHPSLRAIKSFSDVEFPKSAKVLNSHGRKFLEIHIVAKIEMDRADVRPFIKSLPKPYKIDKERESIFLERGDWWDPATARQFVVVEIQEPDSSVVNRVCRMLIRLDDPQKAIVYFDYCSFH